MKHFLEHILIFTLLSVFSLSIAETKPDDNDDEVYGSDVYLSSYHSIVRDFQSRVVSLPKLKTPSFIFAFSGIEFAESPDPSWFNKPRLPLDKINSDNNKRKKLQKEIRKNEDRRKNKLNLDATKNQHQNKGAGEKEIKKAHQEYMEETGDGNGRTGQYAKHTEEVNRGTEEKLNIREEGIDNIDINAAEHVEEMLFWGRDGTDEITDYDKISPPSKTQDPIYFSYGIKSIGVTEIEIKANNPAELESSLNQAQANIAGLEEDAKTKTKREIKVKLELDYDSNDEESLKLIINFFKNPTITLLDLTDAEFSKKTEKIVISKVFQYNTELEIVSSHLDTDDLSLLKTSVKGDDAMGKKRGKWSSIAAVVQSGLNKKQSSVSVVYTKSGKEHKVSVNITKPIAEEISAEFSKLNKLFNFYNIPPEDQFTAFLDKNNGNVKEIISLRKKLVNLERKIEIKKQQLTSPKKQRKPRKQTEQNLTALKQYIKNAKNRLSDIDVKADEKTADIITAIENYQIAKEVYQQIFWTCKIIADHVEENNDHEDSVAYEHASKMFTIFYQQKDKNKALEAFKRFETFVLKHNLVDPKKYKKGTVDEPVFHDTLVHMGFPKDGKLVSITKWRELILKRGISLLKLFARSDLIEKKLKKKYLEKQPDSEYKGPKTIEAINKANAEIVFKKGGENPELARILSEYKASEEEFEAALKMMSKLKTNCNVPEIKIDGAKYGLSGKWLINMPAEDPNACALGYITACCFRPLGHAHQCLKKALTSENDGIWVLLDEKRKQKKLKDPLKKDGTIDYNKYDIKGMGYVWLSKNDNLVINSWERSESAGKYDKAAGALLEAAAKEIVDKESSPISRVMIGQSNRANLKFYQSGEKHTDYCIDRVKEGNQYHDSLQQWAIYESETLKRKRELIRETVKKFYTGNKEIETKHLVSEKSCDSFLKFLKNSSDKDKHNIQTILENDTFVESSLLAILLKENSGSFFKDVAGMKKDKIEVLAFTRHYHIDSIECDAPRAYRKGWATFDQLKGFSVKKIKALTSWCAQNAYKEKLITFKQLESFSFKKIEALTSWYPQAAYKEKLIAFKQLGSFSFEKIKALISSGAQATYEAGATFEQLSELYDTDNKKFEALISEMAQAAYRSGATFEQLSGLYDTDNKKFEALISSDAQEVYENNLITFDQLNVFSASKIEALVSRFAKEAYKREFIAFKQLKDLSVEKIKALTSWTALKPYDAGATFEQLSTLYDRDVTKFKVLASYDAIGLYKKPMKYGTKIISGIFKTLFAKGISRGVEREKIHGDISKIFEEATSLSFKLLASYFLHKDATKHPLMLHIAAQYLQKCAWTKASYFFATSGIQFRKDFIKQPFDLEKIISEYQELTTNEIENIEKLAFQISDAIKYEYRTDSMSLHGGKYSSAHLAPYADMIIISDLISRCSQMKKTSKSLPDNIFTESTKGQLTDIYKGAFKNMRDPGSIKKVLSKKETTQAIDNASMDKHPESEPENKNSPKIY